MSENIKIFSSSTDNDILNSLKEIVETFKAIRAAEKLIQINIYSGDLAEKCLGKKFKMIELLGHFSVPRNQIKINTLYNPFLSQEVHLSIYDSAKHPFAFLDYNNFSNSFDSDNFNADDDPQKGFDAALKKATALLPAIEKKYGTSSEEYKYSSRALNVYQDAGVVKNFLTLTKGTLGSTIGTFRDYNTGTRKIIGSGKNTAEVTIDKDQNKKGTDLLNTIAHEGSHAQDYLDYQGAKIRAFPYSDKEAENLKPEESQKAADALDAVFHGSLRITHEESETRAYIVSSVFAEFTIGGGTGEDAFSSAGGTTTWKFDLPPEKSINVGGESVWKSSWKKNSNDKIREDRLKAIKAGLSKDPRYSAVLNIKILDDDIK